MTCHVRLATTTLSLCATLLPVAASAAPVAGQGIWESTLLPRAVGGTVVAYYDSVLDLTWLADADAARTRGDDADGQLSFDEAVAWASALDIGGVAGWRLPTLQPVNGLGFQTATRNDASSDVGFAATGSGWLTPGGAPASELGHLFYVTLANRGFCAPDSGDAGGCNEQPGWGLANTGPFAGLVAAAWWTDTVSGTTTAWSFNMGFGFQNASDGRGAGLRAWAVHQGDPLAAPPGVPLPAAGPLLLVALGCLMGRAARRPAHRGRYDLRSAR